MRLYDLYTATLTTLNIYTSVLDAKPIGDANRLLGSIPRNSADLFQQCGLVTDAKALGDKVDPTKHWALRDGRIPQGAALTVEQMFTAMGEWKKPKK